MSVQRGRFPAIHHPVQLEARPVPGRRRLRWLLWVGGGVTLLVLGVAASLVWVARRAEPMLRERMVAMLSARFHSPVELDGLRISVVHGLLVEGTGLRILYLAGPTKPDARPAGAPPMLTVRTFQFRTGLRELLKPTLRVVTVDVQGAEVHIPPKEERGTLLRPDADDPARRGQPEESFLVDKLVFDDLKIVIETRRQGKVPLEFDIANLTMRDVGRRQPLSYDATVRNPKPVGDVRAVGHFGPWQDDNPRDTPIDGDYIFSHADLGTIKGLGGMLASNGRFAGTLGGIGIDGVAEVPEFRLTTSAHAVPLHAKFHSVVDATTGDTYLDPVRARLGRSDIVATGSITRKPGVSGHDVELDVVMDRARVEDLLTLGVRSSPVMVRGALATRAHVSVPQGGGSVTRRMRLNGTFDIEQATFGNAKFQQQIDEVSERARGWPERANKQEAAAVTSSMKGSFAVGNEELRLPGMVYAMPGATVRVEGVYGLDGRAMDLHGTVRTEATASEMVTGWKSLLVMPFDKLLKKNGAGLELPFKVEGTQAEPKLALDFGRKTPGIPLPR